MASATPDLQLPSQACAGTKFVRLCDSWLPRISNLQHTCPNSLDQISHLGPDSNPGRYCWIKPVSTYLAKQLLTLCH